MTSFFFWRIFWFLFKSRHDRLRKLILANQAPDLKEDNKLPSKLREILRYNEEMKAKKKSLSQNKNKKNLLKKASTELLLKKPDEQGAQVPLRPVAELKQQNNESEAKFLNRIERVIRVFAIVFLHTQWRVNYFEYSEGSRTCYTPFTIWGSVWCQIGNQGR